MISINPASVLYERWAYTASPIIEYEAKIRSALLRFTLSNFCWFRLGSNLNKSILKEKGDFSTKKTILNSFEYFWYSNLMQKTSKQKHRNIFSQIKKTQKFLSQIKNYLLLDNYWILNLKSTWSGLVKLDSTKGFLMILEGIENNWLA